MHYIFKLDPKKPPSPPPERSSIDCVFTQRIIPSEWNLGFAAMKKRQDGEEK